LTASSSDLQSPLTVLMNAECQFPGANQPQLSGGREFLDGLVTAVSHYGQQLLSGIARPLDGETAAPVTVKAGQDASHHVIVRSAPLGELGVDSQVLPEVDVQLTTLQFHDLMEAIDQLLADSQTLPDLTSQLQSVPRQLVKPTTPMVQRATPAVLGAATLTAAGLALFFVPVPEVTPPEAKPPATGELSTAPPTAGSGDQPQGDESPPTPEDFDQSPPITDPETLALLQRDLTRTLQQDWPRDAKPSGDLSYRLAVSEEGDILAYKYQTDLALAEVDRTPLPKLAFDPVASLRLSQEPVGQFRATFSPAGQVLVEPWGNGDPAGDSSSSSSASSPSAELPQIATKITDRDRIRQLNDRLYDRILANLEPLSANEALSYRVRLNREGAIVAYAPVNAAAGLLAQETPLPQLVDNSASPGDDQLDFMVVFTAAGILQVSPWDGWP
jgi:hypothetical protein